MKKITSHLWFDTEAKEAAEFYVETFGNGSKIKSSTTIKNTPSGDADLVIADILGHEFSLLAAGPYFTLNPSISFMVACESKEEVDALWKKLEEGGTALMPLDTYPFSERYGWIKDQFGVSWQLSYSSEATSGARITPSLLFVGDVCGKAEEAMREYVSIFGNSSVNMIAPYPEGSSPDKPGTVMYGSFTLAGHPFAAMDSALKHDFAFNEGISLMAYCDTQEEIDRYWESLSAVPEAEQCGWLKDRFGVSWQIVPTIMDEMMLDPDEEKVARVTKAFLTMKKFDIKALTEAYEG